MKKDRYKRKGENIQKLGNIKPRLMYV